MEKMNERSILRSAVKERCIKQAYIATKLGIPQNALRAKMTRERMSVDTFKSVLDVMDYDIAVIDRVSGEICWVVDTHKI